MRKLLIPLMLGLALLLAPLGWADTYVSGLAAKFSPSTHVVVDPQAHTPLPQAAQLNGQILNGHHPIYVASVPDNQTGIATPEAIESTLSARVGHPFDAVIVVMDGKGYKAQAFNVPKSIADATGPTLNQAVDSHRNDPFGALTQFVSNISQVKAAGPITSTVMLPAKATSYAWVWWTLGIIGGILALIGAFFGIRALARKRNERVSERNRLRQDLISSQYDVDDLADATLAGKDVSIESSKASTSWFNANEALKKGDYVAAEAHLKNVHKVHDKAQKTLNPDVAAVNLTPLTDRKQGTVKAKNPATGRSVVINNTNYRTQPSSQYNNYYAGGMYNGMYFYPGYYPYPFYNWGWSPTDVILMDAMLNDRWAGNYEATPATAPGVDIDYQGNTQDWNADSNWTDTSSSDSPETDVSYSGGSDNGSSSSSPESDYSYSGTSDSSSSSSSSSDSGWSSGWDSGSSSSSSSSSWDSGSSSSSSWDSGSSFDSGSSGGDFGGGGW